MASERRPMTIDALSIKPRKFITTWLYLEDKNEGGIYPQVRGNPSSAKVHDIYKRCLVTFFHSARRVNTDAHLLLFSNINLNLSSSPLDIKLVETLSMLNVEIIVVPYTFRPPSEQLNWRNQFFVLDILNHLSKQLHSSDLCLVLDGDVIWSGAASTNEMWDQLFKEGSLTMLPIESFDENINGLTLQELKSLSHMLGNLKKNEVKYAGGEFIALRGDKLQEIVTISAEIWKKYNDLLQSSQIDFIEEAHFLSIVYSLARIEFGTGNRYIRRIWTQIFHYSNREVGDMNLVIWHLPAEKRFGIRRIANSILRKPQYTWPNFGSVQWIRIRDSLGIIKTPPMKYLKDFSRSLMDRVFS